MYIHESGSLGRPTIVFLHGNGANGRMWKSHMEQLADFHCLAPISQVLVRAEVKNGSR